MLSLPSPIPVNSCNGVSSTPQRLALVMLILVASLSLSGVQAARIPNEELFETHLSEAKLHLLSSQELSKILEDSQVTRCVSLWTKLVQLLDITATETLHTSKLVVQDDQEPTPTETSREVDMKDIDLNLLHELKDWLERKLLKPEREIKPIFEPDYISYLVVSKCAHLVEIEQDSLLNLRFQPKRSFEKTLEKLNQKDDEENSTLRQLKRQLEEVKRDRRAIQSKLEGSRGELKELRGQLARLNSASSVSSSRAGAIGKGDAKSVSFAESSGRQRRRALLTDQINQLEDKIVDEKRILDWLKVIELDRLLPNIEAIEVELDRMPLKHQLTKCQRDLKRAMDRAWTRQTTKELELSNKQAALESCRNKLRTILDVVINIERV